MVPGHWCAAGPHSKHARAHGPPGLLPQYEQHAELVLSAPMARHARHRRIPSSMLGPGALTAPAGAEPTRLRCTRYQAGGIEVAEGAQLEQCGALSSGARNVWLEVVGLGSVALFQDLQSKLRVPFLALEEVLTNAMRPRCEVLEDGLFLILPQPASSGALEIHTLGLFLRGQTLITFQSKPGPFFDELHQRLRDASSRVRSQSIDYLMYRIIDLVVDRLFPVIDPLAQQLEKIETEATTKPSPLVLRRLYLLIREVRSLERMLLPLRDSIASARHGGHSMIQPTTEPFLRDVQDHVAILAELCAHYSAVGREIRELVHDELNLRLNQAMRLLTAVTVIFIPLSFVTSLYGMNFKWMPELGWRYGYFAVLAVLGVAALLLVLYFRRIGWLSAGSPGSDESTVEESAPAQTERSRGSNIESR